MNWPSYTTIDSQEIFIENKLLHSVNLQIYYMQSSIGGKTKTVQFLVFLLKFSFCTKGLIHIKSSTI